MSLATKLGIKVIALETIEAESVLRVTNSEAFYFEHQCFEVGTELTISYLLGSQASAPTIFSASKCTFLRPQPHAGGYLERYGFVRGPWASKLSLCECCHRGR